MIKPHWMHLHQSAPVSFNCRDRTASTFSWFACVQKHVVLVWSLKHVYKSMQCMTACLVLGWVSACHGNKLLVQNHMIIPHWVFIILFTKLTKVKHVAHSSWMGDHLETTGAIFILISPLFLIKLNKMIIAYDHAPLGLLAWVKTTCSYHTYKCTNTCTHFVNAVSLPRHMQNTLTQMLSSFASTWTSGSRKRSWFDSPLKSELQCLVFSPTEAHKKWVTPHVCPHWDPVHSALLGLSLQRTLPSLSLF